MLNFVSVCLPSFSAIKGKVYYSIPVDYSKLNEQEIELKARDFFFNAERSTGNQVNEDLTNALLLYNILQSVNPNNIEYPIKAGILYDKINKDKLAKGNFSRAIGIDKNYPKTYFYLGEFYYKRQLYKHALKYYGKSYELGYNTNYDLLLRLGDIYEKFGDTRSALKYLFEAHKQSPNLELDEKINKIKNFDMINKEYYSDTRIRKLETQ
jgi:tetratricopeptide (TPR) repeat protein